ncbi:MAG: hypothetical protein GX620_12065 [Chloroflexi bacterium]|nr:hypothetical protein [Chloroflexota bacterium]
MIAAELSFEDRVRLAYPLPVASLYQAAFLESDPRLRVRALIDLFEGVVRYLVLTGLSCYAYYERSDAKLEAKRAGFDRPSLGIWTALLNATNDALQQVGSLPSLLSTGKIGRDDPIYAGLKELHEILTGTALSSKRPSLTQFLEAVVAFRNKKIGHGQLSDREASRVAAPLTAAISQWMTELPWLYSLHLVYVNRVEWRDPCFVCYGTNLNRGTSLMPFDLIRSSPITHDSVYLYEPGAGLLVPLYPFFVFDTGLKTLYAYSELDPARGLVLRCPYESVGAEAARYVSYDQSIITGGNGQETKPDQDRSGKDSLVETLSKRDRVMKDLQAKLSESWLTDSQRGVWEQLQRLMGPPYYVVNIYGAEGAGKTFLGQLLERQARAAYATADAIPWESWKGRPLVVLDGYDSSRRAVRSLRSMLQLYGIGQAIILSRQRVKDDIPCLHLAVTEHDLQIARATLYRELGVLIPDGDHRNLWDCFDELEVSHD